MAALALTMVAVQQRQDIRQKAASPTGTASIQITPNASTMLAGSPQTLILSALTPSLSVDGFQIIATLSGTIPSDIAFQPATIDGTHVLMPSLNKTSTNSATLTFAIVTADPQTPITAGLTNLGQLTFTAPSTGNLTISFDQTYSKILQNKTVQDVLRFPQNTTYTFVAPTPSPAPSDTPTPTPLPPTPTNTPTPTPTLTNWQEAVQILNPTNNAGYLTLPRNGKKDSINLNNEFTLEFWFKLNTLTPYRQHIFRSADSHMDIFAETSSGFTRVKIALSNGTNSDLFYATGEALQVGKWNHFALSFIPTLTGGSFMSYLNGRSTYHSYVPFGSVVPFNDTGADLQFAFSYDSYPGIVNGAIDDLLISSIARYPYQTGPGTYTVPTQPFTQLAQNIALFHFDNTYSDTMQNVNAIVPTGSVSFIPNDTTITPAPSPSPSPNPTDTFTPTPTPSPSPTPTSSPTPTQSPTPSPTPSLSPTPTPSNTPTPIPTPPTCNTADLNKDGVVNGTDLNILLSDFFKTNPTNVLSDINGDGIVDITDYSLLVAQLNKGTGPCL